MPAFQRGVVVLPGEELVIGYGQLLGDSDRAILGDGFAGLQLLEAPDRDARLPGQLRHAGLALLHPRGEVDFGRRHDADPHSFLLQVGVEGCDVPGLQVLQLDMAERLVDPLHLLRVAKGGLLLQVRPGILVQEDLREVHQPDVAVLGDLMAHPLLEESGLPVQRLLDLTLGHAGIRRPGHLLADLLPVDIVPVGHDDPVAVPSFFNCGRINIASSILANPASRVVEWKGKVGSLTPFRVAGYRFRSG